MSRKKLVRLNIILALMTMRAQCANANTGSEGVEEHCDVTGPDLRTSRLGDAKSCQMLCQRDEACRGWSYISGWNRCALKSAIKSKAKVRMYAGRVDRGMQPAKVAQESWDFDDSGVDYRKIAPLNEASACAQACQKEDRCQAFVFIDGYRVCWLKKSIGQWASKVFYCGRK